MKGFAFTIWADVLPSNTAVIVSLVHLSFSPSTVKRPAGAGRNVRRLPCLCRLSPFDLNAPQHTHHSLNISSYEVFGNVITRVTAAAQYSRVSQPCCVFLSRHVSPTGVMEGQRQVFGPRGRRIDLKRLERCQHTLHLPECSYPGSTHWLSGPDISTSGLDLTCSRKFPIPAKPELQRELLFFAVDFKGCKPGRISLELMDVSALWDTFAGHLVVMGDFSRHC